MAGEKVRTHYRTLVENEYLGQWDLADGNGGFRRAVVIIERVEKWVAEVKRKKKMPDGTYRDEPSKRLKVTFRGKRKAWLAGPVSQRTIQELYGPYLEDWIGKAIALYVDQSVSFGGKKTGGLRVEPKVPRAGTVSEEPLDQPVDVEAAKRIADAVDGSGPAREPGED